MSELTTVETSGFAALGLDSRIVDALTADGYSEPTPIQRESIPHLLQGEDLVGLAATGTGKTAAFSLPIVQRLGSQEQVSGKPSALVIVPTRELAIQVAKAVQKYGAPFRISVLAVYGGTGFGEQVRTLKRGVDVVVATPGRALDHIRRETLNLSGIQTVVLDEADEMLDMGFAEDLEAILSTTPETRQTMLFSATMPPRIEQIAKRHLNKPVRVEVAKPKLAEGEEALVRQTAFLVYREHKRAALTRILDFEKPTAAIIFCRTRSEADEVSDTLNARGYRPESLHGGLSQEQRDRVMRKFRDGVIQLLVATDVAARGLDISHLSHVINYQVPQQAESYVHRIGRVGRAGREGVAITLVEPREQFGLRSIERLTRQPIEFGRIPTNADLQAKNLERIRDELRMIIKEGKLDEFAAVIGPLATEFEAPEIALAAVALATRATTKSSNEPDLPTPRPPQQRGGPSAPRDRGNDRNAPRNERKPFDRGARRSTPNMDKVFLSVGRETGIQRRDIVGAIESEVGLGARDIGTIDVAERFTLVEVPSELTEQVIENLHGIRVRGRRVNARRDRVGRA